MRWPFTILFLACFLFSCGSGDNGSNNDIPDGDEIPQFVDVDYIELDKISRISMFRSAVGHDYSDEFESCRSMKHYFQPHDSLDWSAVKIFAPVSGIVTNVFEEWAGTQVQINSFEQPDFFFNIFHLSLTGTLGIGDTVTAGLQLGTHFGSMTMSDIAVGFDSPDGWRLVSYFDVLTDLAFQDYQARGFTSRNDAIISQTARDADPLTCDNETFITTGTLDDWVDLTGR